MTVGLPDHPDLQPLAARGHQPAGGRGGQVAELATLLREHFATPAAPVPLADRPPRCRTGSSTSLTTSTPPRAELARLKGADAAAHPCCGRRLKRQGMRPSSRSPTSRHRTARSGRREATDTSEAGTTSATMTKTRTPTGGRRRARVRGPGADRLRGHAHALDRAGWPPAGGDVAEGERQTRCAPPHRPATSQPYSLEYEGYMGNWGNTLDRWYHRAAVVVWPR